MATPIDNNNHDKIAFQIRGNASFMSNKAGWKSTMPFDKEMSSALKSLSEMDNSELLRENAIKNGKAIIDNWQMPQDSQIDEILRKMQSDF